MDEKEMPGRIDKGGPGKMAAIRGWSDEQLVQELRNTMRAGLGIEDYRLLLAEGMARLLERSSVRGSGDSL